MREATGDGRTQAAVGGGEGDIGGDHRQNRGNLILGKEKKPRVRVALGGGRWRLRK